MLLLLLLHSSQGSGGLPSRSTHKSPPLCVVALGRQIIIIRRRRSSSSSNNSRRATSLSLSLFFYTTKASSQRGYVCVKKIKIKRMKGEIVSFHPPRLPFSSLVFFLRIPHFLPGTWRRKKRVKSLTGCLACCILMIYRRRRSNGWIQSIQEKKNFFFSFPLWENVKITLRLFSCRI